MKSIIVLLMVGVFVLSPVHAKKEKAEKHKHIDAEVHKKIKSLASHKDYSHITKIETKNGKVYKNVRVLSVRPSGFDISYMKGDVDHIKHLFFKNLSQKTQKKFKYDAEKAQKYEKRLHKLAEERRKKDLERIEKHKETEAEKKALSRRISKGRMHVVVHAISNKPGGVIGWITSPHSTVTQGHYGKAFIAGHPPTAAGGAAGGAGFIYPTLTTKYGYPSYATNLDKAVGIAIASGVQ